MDRVFSVDGISDQFWSAPPPPPPPSSEKGINRSASEWAFQCFLQEADHVAASPSDSSSDQSDDNTKVDEVDVIEVKNSDTNANVNGNIPVDSEGYQAYLKSKLNIACAAVAQSRATFLKPRDSSTRAESGSQASNASQSASNAPSKGAGYDMSKSQDVNTNGSVTIPSLPNTQKKSIVPVKPTRSGSSREQSDDDENEGETELTENMDPADAKRVRRMLSNRESARRSRRRKQAHLTELETQVSQLRVENSSLLKRLTDIRQKYSEAAVDNRVLKADVETLRAKVKMAEETVKRITGLSPMFHTMTDISTVSMPSYDGSASDTSTDAAVPSQDDKKHQFYQPKKNPIANPDQRFQNALLEISSVENVQPNSAAPHLAGSKMGRTSSLQRVASLEHLQKRIRGGVTCGTQSSGDQQ